MTTSSPCGVCGSPLDPSRAVYDKKGNLCCPSCAAKAQIAEGEGRAVRSLVSGAIGVAVAGVLAWTCLNFLFILSIAAVAGGIGWILTIARAPEYRARMGGKFIPSLIAVALGMAMGATPPALMLLGVTLSVVGG